MTGSNSFWFANPGQNFYNGVISQSLRLSVGSDYKLDRQMVTPTSVTGTICTASWWMKKLAHGTVQSYVTGRDNQASGEYCAYWSYGTNGSSISGTDNHSMRSGGAETILAGTTTTVPYRDSGGWYHVVIRFDSTQSTAADRIRIYKNGVQQNDTFNGTTYPSQNAVETYWNNAGEHLILFGNGEDSGDSFDGYIAEFNWVDGLSLAPESFGESKNGVWIPKKYTGAYGLNGSRYTFADSSDIGKDTSGVGNDLDRVSNLAASDVVPDSPENNFCTLNPLYYLTASTHLSEGGLQLTHESTAHRANAGTMFSKTGKWYFEVRNKTDTAGSSVALGVGLQDTSKNLAYSTGDNNYIYYCNNNSPLTSLNTTTNSLGSFVAGAGDIMQVAYDADSGKLFIGKNNTYVAADSGTDGNPATGANPTATLSTTIDYIPFVGTYNNEATANFGQDDTFAGAISSAGNTDGNGRGVFKYAPPSGFLALCSANLPEPTIGSNSATQSDDHFNSVLYTSDNIGANGTQNVTGVGFKPDWVWLKNRTSGSTSHTLYDSSRGTGRHLSSDTTGAEVGLNSEYGYLGTFGDDGYTLRGGSTNANYVNQSTDAYASWNWKANGGTTVTNTDGSIDSTVQANTDAGFSIVTYSGNTDASATIGHGLGKTPKVIFAKQRDEAGNWIGFTETTGATKKLNLNETTGSATSALWNDTAPTSTVFSVKDTSSQDTFGDGHTYVAYCFAEIEGYSKFGSYVGNSNADGAFVYFGFRPTWVLIKNTSTNDDNWYLADDVRDTDGNPMTEILNPNRNAAEYTTGSNKIDFTSNGIKMRDSASGDTNISGEVYFYMAFAKAPFKYANAK